MNNYHKYLSVTNFEEKWGFYITTVGYSKTNPNEAYPPNNEHPITHSFTWNKGRILNDYYLIFISKGQGVFESALTSPSVITAGTCFFLFPSVWHRYKPASKVGWEEYWIGFKGSYADELMKKGFFSADIPVVNPGLNEALLSLIYRILDNVRSSTIGYRQIIPGIALQILGLVHSLAVNEQSDDPDLQLIAKAKFLLQERLEIPVNVRDLIRELPMGYSKFRKKFKEVTGQSPTQYHINLRLDKARELLTSTHLNVNEVAYQLGFDSVFYFSRLFKKKNGISPKFYRLK